MKTKQVIGIVIAAVVFVLAGFLGVVTSSLVGDFTSGIASGFSRGESLPPADYLGIVSIEGTIGSFANYNKGEIVANTPIYYIEQYKNDPNNKGIMLYIDSGGGSVYETDEIYLALMEYKKDTGRPVYAWSGSLVGSGAYYIACAADEIYVNRNCWAGSIGVYLQITNFAGLLEKFGVENEYIKTGDNKAMGSNLEHLTDEQRAIYQSLVDDSFENFLAVVMAGRGYTRDELLPIADGRVYTASQAVENGLVDGVENLFSDYLKAAMTRLGAVAYHMPTTPANWLSFIMGEVSALVPKSELQAAAELIENDESGVLMYYYGG